MKEEPKRYSFRKMPKNSNFFELLRNVPDKLHERKDKIFDRMPPIFRNMQISLSSKFGFLFVVTFVLTYKALWSL